MNPNLEKALRWVAVPFMFPIGMLLGHLLGLMNGVFMKGVIGTIILYFICGVLTSVGCIFLPAYVAPAKRERVAKIALVLQVILIVASIVIAFVNKSYEGKELTKYVVSMIGTLAGAVWCKMNIKDHFKD